VHSRITFYVYAKIGQANGGGEEAAAPPPPMDPPLVAWSQTVKSIAATRYVRV